MWGNLVCVRHPEFQCFNHYLVRIRLDEMHNVCWPNSNPSQEPSVSNDIEVKYFYLVSPIDIQNIEYTDSPPCQDLCPAVYLHSYGPSATHHPHSLGCFNYVGSLMSDEYPLYSNTHGLYLTPDSVSNPVLGRTRWIVSHSMLSDISQGTIRCM